MLRVVLHPHRSAWPQLLARPLHMLADALPTVQQVLQQVQQQGDEAVARCSRQWDDAPWPVPPLLPDALQQAGQQVEAALRTALQRAARNIEAFHAAQQRSPLQLEVEPGLVCSRHWHPLQRVGLYVPGGSAPLFSTVLMLGIPARLAGCSNVVLCTPPQHGKLHPALLYAAHLAGIHEVWPLGGAQAIAAMAFGTETLPRVDKIFGPGNTWVNLAKMLVQQQGVAIDLPAGPSEVAVWADDSVPAAWLAADLLAQAEHGPDSQVLLVCTQPQLPAAVNAELERQLASLPRQQVARQALAGSLAVVAGSPDEALDLLAAYAPEHLILALADAQSLAPRVRNAGTVFVGGHSPEALGDYLAGTNHTLPTGGTARAFGGVALESFLRATTYVQATAPALASVAPDVALLARAEGLEAHARSAEVRLAGR